MWIDIAFAATLAAAAAGGDAPLYTTPYFHTLGVAEGMPSSRVYKSVQDHDGYLWFGTQDGLARYDGVGFRVYRHDPKDPQSLGGNAVSALFVDRDNRLWCGAEESGLSLLDPRRRAFVHFRHDDRDPASLGSDDVWVVTQDDEGAIWVGSYAGGLDRLAPGATAFTHFRHDDGATQSLGSDNVLGLLAVRGELWIGTDAGIDVIGADRTIRHADFSAIPGSGPINAVSLLDAGGGAVFAGTRRGLLRIGRDLKATVVAADALTDKLVFGVVAGRESGELWIATRNGVNRLSAAGTIAPYRQNPAVPGAFPGDTVFDAMRDREGNLWFATFEGGVARLPEAWRNFALYRNDPADARTLSSNRTQGLAADAQGGVWAVNLDGGIDRLDPATGLVERFADRLARPDRTLWSVLPDRLGRVWVGHTRGVRVYKLHSGEFIDIPVDARRADALAPGLVYHLVQDPAGPVWAASYGSSGGVQRIDPTTLAVERFDANSAGLRNAEIDQLGFDAAGALLVASGAGLDRFDGAAKKFTAVAGAPTQRVYAFAFAGDGTLWLHVLGALEHYRNTGAGLALLDRIDAQAGWPALTVGGLQADAAGMLWVSSPRGLWRYDPRAKTIRVFDHRDGLASSEFNRLPLLRRSDGAIFGGTLAGIVGFLPARLDDTAAASAPIIDAIAVRRDGRDLALDESSRQIALQWDDRDLRIGVRSLSYANPSANRYRWKLTGFDSDWVDSGNRGEREFSQLPPGDYRLRFGAANAAGVWYEAESPLQVIVARPPWATPLALALYALLALFVMASLFRAYRGRVRRRYTLALAEQRRNLAEQTSAAKTQFLATMGHEIRTPMTGVLGMTELLMRTRLDAAQRGYAQTILESGRMMLRLVNDSLDLARIEAGRLELDTVAFDLHALLASIGAAAEALAGAKGLRWTLAIGADAPRWLRGDAVRVKQVLLNLVNNAIKFTERGSVQLGAAAGATGGVRLQVCDDGPGIAEATRARLFQRFEQADGAARYGGSGLGLAICRELVARMGGKIGLDSEPGRGSTFTVDLPLAVVDADALPPPADATSGDRADAGAPRRSLRVLLVEDDAVVADVIAGLLCSFGHVVTRAAQGLAALAEFDVAVFDLALIDLDLPAVDGLALARLLRAREAQTGKMRIPLIGISARSVGDEEALCLAAGMDAFLRKPLTGEMLVVRWRAPAIPEAVPSSRPRHKAMQPAMSIRRGPK